MRGALRVRIDNPDSDLVLSASRLTLVAAGSERTYEVASVHRANPTTLRLTLAGVDTIEGAQALRGAIVTIAKTELPPPAPGEFYYFQAVGCAVVTLAGERIGAVEEVFSTGANDVLVVRDADKEVLVPVIEDVVKSIDLEARVITVEAIPGLLDPA